MKSFSIFKIALFALVMSFPILTHGQIETRKITFAAGKSSTTVSSAIKGDKTIDYKVNAQQGQELKVSLKTNNTANSFNILPPGSTGESIFTGSNDGNTFSGTMSTGGEYTIRVYLMRSAARRNEKASFKLTVSLSGGQAASAKDAKVKGTNYNATGKVRSSLGNEATGSVMSDFGVIRKGSNKAEVNVTYPKLMKRILFFENGEWTSPGANVKVKKVADEWEITVNDYEHYQIPDAVITGG